MLYCNSEVSYRRIVRTFRGATFLRQLPLRYRFCSCEDHTSILAQRH